MHRSLLLAALAMGPLAQAGELDALVGITNEIGSISGIAVDIDMQSGQGTAFASISRPGISLAFVDELNRLYVALPMGGGVNNLVVLDNRTYAESAVVGEIRDVSDGSTHKVSAMGSTPDGRLFGISRRRASIGGFNVPEGVLIEIDPHTAQATTIGGMGMAVRARGGTIKDGRFYMSTNPDDASPEQVLFRIDLGTAATTRVGGTGVYGQAVGLTTGPDNEILATISGDTTPGLASWNPESRLYSVHAGTGQASLIGTTGFDYISSLTYLKYSVSCGLVTAEDLSLAGSSVIDSWDSGAGAYAPGGQDAVICANAAAAVAAGTAEIYGDVFWGTDFSIAGGAVLTGVVEQLVDLTPIPTVDTGPASQNNDNGSLPNGTIDGSGNLALGTRQTLAMAPGVYHVNNLTIGNRAQLQVSGPTEIWVDGDIVVSTNAQLNPGGVPTNLTIYSNGLNFSSSGTSYGSFVMPRVSALLAGRGATYGYFLAHDVTFEGQHDFHHDLAASAQF